MVVYITESALARSTGVGYIIDLHSHIHSVYPVPIRGLLGSTKPQYKLRGTLRGVVVGLGLALICRVPKRWLECLVSDYGIVSGGWTAITPIECLESPFE